MKKEMLINVLQPEECRIAIVEDGVLEELYVERTSHETYTGNIYKGKIVNLEPAIQAAFVDFSVGRNGFLHVSDIEPHYYGRHLGDDVELSGRDRGRDPRQYTAEPRATGASSSPLTEDGPGSRDRDGDRPSRPERERPDRSERGRRDRSIPRRFGEGLTDDEDEPPAAPEPPLPPTAEPPAARPSEASWFVDQPPAPRPAWGLPPDEREAPATPAEDQDEPRGRLSRPFEPNDLDEPPGPAPRPLAPPSDQPEPDLGEPDAPRPAALEPETSSPPAPSSGRKPRRGRGGGRAARSKFGRAKAAPEAEPREAGPPEAEAELEPEPAPRPERRPRRRGGRDAIRSRGGERSPATPPGPGDEPTSWGPAVEPDHPRAWDLESEPGPEPEPAQPWPRLHGRAGEPGYVPRRERTRTREPEAEVGPSSFGWGLEPEEPGPWGLEPEEPGPGTAATEPADTELGPAEESRRRRRRRRTRRRERDRDRAEPEPTTLRPTDQTGDLDTRTLLPSARDFEPDEEVFDEDLIDTTEEIAPLELEPEQEEIDPELREEIRKEVEEIAELERALGLRRVATATRPRRGEPLEPAPVTELAEPPARGPRGRGLVTKPPIQDIFKRGDEVLVQVIKESIGTKGPTLSTYISIPGRYLVLMPGLNRVGVSRKITDEVQRRKLRQIMNDLDPPPGLGVIVRTAGVDRTKHELARDLAYLLRLWKVILRRIRKTRAPAPIYQESDMITRTIRDIFTTDIDTIWIDERQAFERAQEFLRVVMPKYVDHVKFYDEKVPIFHKYGIEDEITKIQRRHIPLPEGGSIVIDQTEALVAIDVNSGNFRVENDAERTAYEMNLRAAREIARQLRLRDLGGVIINDFIDMRDERHRRGVERALREAVRRDRARTKVLRMSAFGIIEMTRQRIRPSLKRSVYEDCSHCLGAGVIKTSESMAIDVMRLLALAAHRDDIRRVNISAHAAVATYLNNRKRGEIARLEHDAGMIVHIRHEEGVAAEHLQIDCFDTYNNEVKLIAGPATPPPPSPRVWRKP